MHQLHLPSKYSLKIRVKSMVKKLLIKILSFIASRPKMRAWAVRLAYRLGIVERLQHITQTILQSKSSEMLLGEISLAPRARQIYKDLKIAIAQRHRKV
jgi:hypothetical protein